jgi:pyruvate formate lyase activating enzyme
MEKEAFLYQKLEDNKVRCVLCGHRCVISDGDYGVCQVRQNRSGVLHTLVYGSAISRNIDPIEKKPLYHYYPGSSSFSIATLGCNFQCQWCQNWQIAQMPRTSGLTYVADSTPEQIVAQARAAGSRSIAYTYTEPTIFFEYAYDTAVLARQAGIGNVYVTNGYMTQEMLDFFHPYLDAANVDLKAFRQRTYSKYVSAGLNQVLDSLKYLKKLGVWLEVTSLLIPGINDDPEEIKDMAGFIAEELGPDTPWHISRFYPQYKLTDVPPTPHKTLQTAHDIGKEAGLKYVYMGNIHGESNTDCPNCGTVLIPRYGYQVGKVNLHDGKCPNCGEEITGVWE